MGDEWRAAIGERRQAAPGGARRAAKGGQRAAVGGQQAAGGAPGQAADGERRAAWVHRMENEMSFSKKGPNIGLEIPSDVRHLVELRFIKELHMFGQACARHLQKCHAGGRNLAAFRAVMGRSLDGAHRAPP